MFIEVLVISMVYYSDNGVNFLRFYYIFFLIGEFFEFFFILFGLKVFV